MLVKWWGSGIKADPRREADPVRETTSSWRDDMSGIIRTVDAMLKQYGDAETVILDHRMGIHNHRGIRPDRRLEHAPEVPVL